VIERLAGLEDEYRAIEARLADPDVVSDLTQLRDLNRRYTELGAVVSAYREYRGREDDLATAKELLVEASGDERELARVEVSQAEADLARLEDELKLLLLPRDPNAGKNVIVEIRGAEGGEEANLFARDLYDMYQAYSTRVGWRTELLSADPSDMGGFNEVTFIVRGDDAWSRLKFEGGPHRVQRVPVTESQGRIHTSSATVTVLPEADEVDVDIDPNELQIDVYRSSGPGGQSVNTTYSAVRITHLPTNTVVSCQDEKSQIKNREKAMKVLRARLYEVALAEQQSQIATERRSMVGTGDRSEKIRTYNFPQNRVTDHRIGLTMHQLQTFLDGDLDEMVGALIAHSQAEKLKAPLPA
jgi:peptide chain release factor 1